MSDNTIKRYLESKAAELRLDSIVMTTIAGSGHPTSCLSAADLVAAIFFYAMRIDSDNFTNPNNDHFILSKGHAAPLLYAAWKQLGAVSQEQLYTYRKFGSNLEGHPTRKFPFAEAATGSLGMGLSIGAGIALTALLDHKDFRTFVLLGDSELTEGSIWEAAEISSYYKLNSIIAIADINRLGQTGETIHGYHIERYSAKFEAFGWQTIIINGHDMYQIMQALDRAVKSTQQPTIILAKTIKGYGVKSVENKNGFHGKAFSQEETNEIITHLEKRAPTTKLNYSHAGQPSMSSTQNSESCIGKTAASPHYKINTLIATRRAYGDALVCAGNICNQVMSLDAEVKNSTFAEIFEQAYPDRFIQCFIAEQNMVSMAVGLQSQGKIPFVSTFAAFFSRAHDQLRMAAIGESAIRCVGSHAGVSIGADGPSQMGLEDISLFSCLPGSAVLYPCDAVSTHYLVNQMLEYNQGISYLRTTRMATPVIYANDQEFVIGKCIILKKSDHDQACIIAAGVTVHEALKAYDRLAPEQISISIIDLYSIKPLDIETLITTAKNSGNIIITVEDHYMQGGIGEQICYALKNSDISIHCLAVTQLPRSGKPEELMAWANIDAAAIVKTVKKALTRF